MSCNEPIYASMSQRVLDAATQLDKRLRDDGAPLDKVSSLVKVLSDPELRRDIHFQQDLWRTLRKLGERPSTVDQLNATVERELDGLISAMTGDMASAKRGLVFCLAMHESVMRECLRTDWTARSSIGSAA